MTKGHLAQRRQSERFFKKPFTVLSLFMATVFDKAHFKPDGMGRAAEA